MDRMVEFFTVMLRLTADFLGTEPIIYIVGLVFLVFIVKILRQLMP